MRLRAEKASNINLQPVEMEVPEEGKEDSKTAEQVMRREGMADPMEGTEVLRAAALHQSVKGREAPQGHLDHLPELHTPVAVLEEALEATTHIIQEMEDQAGEGREELEDLLHPAPQKGLNFHMQQAEQEELPIPEAEAVAVEEAPRLPYPDHQKEWEDQAVPALY